MNVLKTPKKLVYNFVYNHEIDSVWGVIKDHSIIADLLKKNKVYCEFKLIQGQSSFEIGAVFTIKCNFLYEMQYKVVRITDQEDYKELVLKSMNSNFWIQFEWEYVYKLYKTMENELTLVSIEFATKDGTVLPDVAQKIMKKELDFQSKVVNSYLNENPSQFNQIESILIKCPHNKIWKIISDWKIFKDQVPFLAEDIEYDGPIEQSGSSVVMKWPSKDVEVRLKITEHYFDDREEKCILSMKCEGGQPKPPSQSLSLTLKKLENNLSFLEFNHVFYEKLTRSHINQISKDKRKILSELRKKLEDKSV